MSEDQEREPETQPEGRLEPPIRKPPTAVGACTPEPDDHPVKEVVITDRTRIRDLAKLMHVPTHRILWAAYNELGKLVTINRVLPFEDSKALAAHFGYSARREPRPRRHPGGGNWEA